MNALHTPALLAQAQAVPFTAAEATAAEKGIMGRYTRAYLRQVLIARRIMRANLRAAIEAKRLVIAYEYAAMLHSTGVQAVVLVRRHARTMH